MKPPVKRTSIVLLARGDLVRLAQCMAIDADSFPYPSIPLGVQAAPHIWIARSGASGPTLGFIAASGRSGSFYVHGIAVVPSARRKGAGRALLVACADHARFESFRKVVLHVGVENDSAITLYQSEGFEIRREVRDFYPPGVYPHRAAYEMVLWT